MYSPYTILPNSYDYETIKHTYTWIETFSVYMNYYSIHEYMISQYLTECDTKKLLRQVCFAGEKGLVSQNS